MAEKKPGIASLVLPIAFYVLAAALGAVTLTNARDAGAIEGPLPLRWGLLVFAAGGVAKPILRHFDRPKGYAGLAGTATASAGWGAVAATALLQFVAEGPGWPWTPWALFGAVMGLALTRAHAPLLREAVRERESTPDRLPTRAYVALGVLIAGYAALGFAGFFVFRALFGGVPLAGRILTVLLAGYVLLGLKLLLSFASLEAKTSTSGFWPWFRANAVQNAVVALVLVAYLAFRSSMSGAIPYFPLYEFGFAVAVFGFVLARLRAKLKDNLAETAIVSTRRRHAQRAEPLLEPEYQSLAGAVRGFVERGRALRAYEEGVKQAARIESETVAAEALAPVRAHSEDPPEPPLPIGWATGAVLASSAGFALFVYAFFEGLDSPPRGPAGGSFTWPLALVILAIGIYRLVGRARAYFRPVLSVVFAAVSAVAFFAAFALFAVAIGDLGTVPLFVWGIVSALMAAMVATAAWSAWGLKKEIASNPLRFFPDESQDALNANAREKARKRLITVAAASAGVFLVVPTVIDFLVTNVGLPEAIAAGYQRILPPVALFLAGLGIAAGLELAGLARERPRAIEREARLRARRLALHREVMTRIEKV